MTSITFGNGATYETLAVYGGNETHQGALRSTLDIVIESTKLTFDEAKSIWKDKSSTSEMTLNGDEKEILSVKLNYSLPLSLTLTELNGVEVVRMKLAQKSDVEIAQEKQATDIAACEAAIIDIGELLGGEE